MTINVAKVSPSIHEGTIAKFMKQDDDDDVIAQLHDAVKALRTQCEKAVTASGAILSNVNLSEPARHRQARDRGFGLIEPALKVIDEASKEAQAEIAATTAKLKGPPRSKDPLVRAELAEVRTWLLAMQPETRNKIIDEAIASGDDARKAVGKALATPKPNNLPRAKTKSRIQNRRAQETKT